MVRVQGGELPQTTGFLRAEARKAPVEVAYRGRPKLVVLSAEDYALLRQNRKLAVTRADMPREKLERIANNRMDEEHAGLDALMNEWGMPLPEPKLGLVDRYGLSGAVTPAAHPGPARRR